MTYLIFSVFFFNSSRPAEAGSVPDVGMVTLLKGKVTYWNDTAGQDQADAVNFMKIRQDDQFRLGPDACIGLIFFASGRRETWDGPAHFRLLDTGGNAMMGKNPRVNQLPVTAVREIRRISPLVDPSRIQRSGYEQSRGTPEKNPGRPEFKSDILDADEKKAVAAARQVYEQLRSFSEPDDIGPELYLFNILSDYDQYAEMDRLLAVMRGKQGNMAGAEGLAEWLNDRYNAWLKLQY
ncbi:MAG: hypothetical protein AB7S75_14540 [Desulfococcaceae bacterium]